MVIMEQYEKSGPKQERPPVNKEAHDISQLQEMVMSQGRHIKQLEKEITRLKTKLDAHAVTINQIKRG
jgi:predicted RNase H-like nuclease (RuvC/YqgF family)